MHNPQIWTILGLSCAILGFELCAGNHGLGLSINPLRAIIRRRDVHTVARLR